MRLLILRHGPAVDREEWRGPDPLRPLTSLGRKRTRRMAKATKPLVPGFHSIWTSPWLRALDTAELAGSIWGLPVEQHTWLAGDGPAAGDTLSNLPREDTILVGHEPDLGELIGVLCGGPALPLKKAGMALLDGHPVAGGMILNLLLTPPAVRLLQGKQP
jgi:phosphohistidine phosphatase